MAKKQTPLSEAAGQRLRALRLSKGFLKIRHFAEEIGVPEDRYDKWEKGKALIPPERVYQLKLKFGITSDWLYFGDETALPNVVSADLRLARTA